LLCLRNARAFPLLPAALASVPFGFVLVRVRVLWNEVADHEQARRLDHTGTQEGTRTMGTTIHHAIRKAAH